MHHSSHPSPGRAAAVLAALLLCPPAALAQDEAGEPAPSDAATETPAEATEPPAERSKRLHVDHLLGVGYGPLGVLYQVDPMWRLPLFPGTDSLLLRDAHIGAGATAALAPAFLYYGPAVTIAPLTILKVTVQLTHVNAGVAAQKYGLLDFSELGQFADYSYGWRNDNGAAIGERTSRIWSLFVRPVALMKVGPVILVYSGTYMYYHPTEHKGLYYNFISDMVLSPWSWCLMHDAMALFEVGPTGRPGSILRIGVSNRYHQVLEDDGRTAIRPATQWKVGPMVAWTVADSWDAVGIGSPTVVLQAHWFYRDAIASESAKRAVNAVIALRFSTHWYE